MSQHFSSPLISCLMVSRGELFPARFAIECYRRQTYSNRELVIVSNSPSAGLEDLLCELKDPTIRLVASKGGTLGELRNVSVEAAEGALLCQWDDDDLYHRKRLEVQASVLFRANRHAVFLQRWLMWFPRARRLALSPRRIWEGSMLIRRERLPKYPILQRGEDSKVILAIISGEGAVFSYTPYLYCYIYHGRNTWPEDHFRGLLKASVDFPDYDKKLSELATLYPMMRYQQALAEQGA